MSFEDALRDVTSTLAMTFNPEVEMNRRRMEEQKRQAAIEQLSSGIQSGAIDPTAGNQQLRQLGVTQAIGPNQLTLDRQQQLRDKQEALAREERIRQGMAPIMQSLQEGKMTPEQAQYAALQLQSQEGQASRTLETIAKPQVQMVQDAQGNYVQVTKPPVGAPVVRETGVKGKVSQGGGGYYGTQTTLSDEEAKYIAGAFKKDKTVILGLRPADKSKVWKFLVAQAQEEGTTPEQLAGMRAEFGGLMAQERTMGTRAGQISIAANEAYKMGDIVSKNMEAVGPTSFVPYNKAVNIANSKTGDPKIKAYVASINAFINSYSRAINPTGAATISDKDHARELLDAADSPEQVKAVINTLKQEMQAAISAPEESRAKLMEEMTKTKKPASTGGWSARIVP